jgi:hypothetical protein
MRLLLVLDTGANAHDEEAKMLPEDLQTLT